MRVQWLAGMILLGPTLVVAQSLTSVRPAVASNPGWENFLVMPTQPARAAVVPGPSRVLVQVPYPRVMVRPTDPNAPAPALLRPGVYKTLPYSCVVVVPGAGLDHRCVVQPSQPATIMPVLRPPLNFVPVKPK